MEEVLTNPSKGIVLVGKNTDPRWPAEEGWVKKTQNVNGYEIHYEYNPRTGEVDDVKFKQLFFILCCENSLFSMLNEDRKFLLVEGAKSLEIIFY